MCVRGLDMSYAYFKERGIPHEKCGKLVQGVLGFRLFLRLRFEGLGMTLWVWVRFLWCCVQAAAQEAGWEINPTPNP